MIELGLEIVYTIRILIVLSFFCFLAYLMARD